MKDFSETFTKLGAHYIVEDGVNSRVNIEHDSGKVEEEVESFDVDNVKDVSL